MAEGRRIDEEFEGLPVRVTAYVRRLVRMIGYRRKVRREVRRELLGHFADALRDCVSVEETEAKAEQLIAEFGDPQLVAVLCRRAKKRCRPWWLKVVGSTRMAIFLLIVGLSSYTTWFIWGKPVVTEEYLLAFNRLRRPQLPVPDNAWPHYERAMTFFVKADEALEETLALQSYRSYRFQGFAAMADGKRESLVAWVTANEPAWGQYAMGSRRSQCWHPSCYGRNLPQIPLLMDTATSDSLVQMRDLARVGVWKARLAAEEGRLDEALEDCMIIARAGAHLQASAGIIEQLLGVGVGAMGRLELLRIVTETDPPAIALWDIQARLGALYDAGYPFAYFEGERLVVLDAIQHTFTQGGFGGGHMIPGQFMAFASYTLELPEGRRTRILQRVLLWPMDVGISMIHARRKRTVAKINEVYDEIDERSRLSPYQRRARGIGSWEQLADNVNMYRYGLVHMLLPDEGRVSELAFQLRADHEATLTVLALKRYHADHRICPPDLRHLVDEGYLPGIPMDPFSDDPLIYKPLPDGFLLYSVGRDFVDDRGRRGVDKEGKPRPWAENGDQVFWPFGGEVE